MGTKALAATKKRARRQNALIVFEDESGVSLLPSVRATWAPRGQTRAVGGSAGAALLGNARSLAVHDRLHHVDAVLIGRVKPALVTKNCEERVDRAAAATGGLAERVRYSTSVDRARRFGSHGTILRSSTAGTWSMGWVRRSGSVAAPPPGGSPRCFSRIGWHDACQAAQHLVTNCHQFVGRVLRA
jgi:hypothetical protein